MYYALMHVEKLHKVETFVQDVVNTTYTKKD